MSFDLKSEEIRVLGVLIEKSLALPEYYPMTLNAIVSACNQKNNRDPVVEYNESQVSAAISSLRRRQLVDQAPPERNSRAIKFQHTVERQFGWNAVKRAIMCELMIRGPQTLGELRTHAGRMTHLESTDYTRELLAELEKNDPPMVVEMEREPGKRERRFAQLLGGPPAITTLQFGPGAPAGDEAMARGSAATASVLVDPMESRVAELERQVAELREKVNALTPAQ